MARRAIEIGSAVAAAEALGLTVAMQTFTMRHHRGQSLETLWAGLQKGWGRVTSGKAWKSAKLRHGVVGYLRVVEVTIGRNGWHAHVHDLVFARSLDDAGLRRLSESMWTRWSAGLQSVGLDAPLPIGSEFHIVRGDLSSTQLGDYLAKGVEAAGAIGMELTQTQSKTARNVYSTRSTWSLLDEGALEGEASPLLTWHEWERVSKGKRQISWSRDLRKLLGIVAPERTDEEIAAEEMGREADTIVWITKRGWSDLVRSPELIPQVLSIAEQAGPSGLAVWLDRAGVEYREV